jgi:hypothetical protein
MSERRMTDMRTWLMLWHIIRLLTMFTVRLPWTRYCTRAHVVVKERVDRDTENGDVSGAIW